MLQVLAATPYYFKKMMVIEEPPYGVCFKSGKASHWAKTMPFPQRLAACWLNHGQARHWEVNRPTFQSQGRTVFHNFCFSEKSVRYSGLVGWRWMPQHYRESLGDCPSSQQSLSFLYFWKLLSLNFLFTQILFILLRSLMKLKAR